MACPLIRVIITLLSLSKLIAFIVRLNSSIGKFFVGCWLRYKSRSLCASYIWLLRLSYLVDIASIIFAFNPFLFELPLSSIRLISFSALYVSMLIWLSASICLIKSGLLIRLSKQTCIFDKNKLSGIGIIFRHTVFWHFHRSWIFSRGSCLRFIILLQHGQITVTLSR